MIKHSTGNKKFNFNNIDQESQEMNSVENPQPRKTKKSYNFSLLDDSDDDIPQQHIAQSSKDAAISDKNVLLRDTTEDEVNEEDLQIISALKQQRQIQEKERDQIFMQQFLTAIIKLQDDKILEKLLQLSKQKKISFVQTNALLYLLLKESFKKECNYCIEENYNQIIISKTPINVDQRSSLRKWVVYSLRIMGQEVSKIIQKRKAPKRLGKLAEHRIKQLAEEFQQAGNYDDCLAVCSIEDMAFRESYEFSSSKEMRNQLGIICAGALKAIPHTFWLVDLSLALLYFEPTCFYDLKKDLNKKYWKTSQTFLAPHYLLLNIMKENTISLNNAFNITVANSPQELEHLNHMLFMWCINSHSSRTVDGFEEAVLRIIKKIHSPSLFIDFLCYIQLGSDKVKEYFEFYLLQNNSLNSNRDEKLEQMKTYITKRGSEIALSGADGPTIQILLKWVKCEKFLHESDKIESIKYLIANFKQLSSTVIHNSEEIYQTMIDSILTFELVCTYNTQKKRELIKVLIALQEAINRKQEMIIISGLIAFIELKSKVFWLLKQEKFSDFYQLFRVLEDRENGGDDSSKRIKTNLIKALGNSLQSFQGELYLQQLCSRYEKPVSVTIAKLIDNPQCSQVSGQQKELLQENPLIKLVTILKTMPKFSRKVVSNLLI